MMEGWIQQKKLTWHPFEKDFNKLTWHPQYYDGQISTVNTETGRGANFLKSDTDYVPWWAHNGLQTHDNDWDLNISYYSNQLDMVVHFLPPLNQTLVQQALTQPLSSVSTTVQTKAVSTQHMTTSSSSSAQSFAVPIFQSGLPTTSTSTSRYTGTGRPTYSRIVTSDGNKVPHHHLEGPCDSRHPECVVRVTRI
jgi:hypothetical protein